MSLPRLPDWVGLRGGSGRAPASRINEIEPRKRTLTISARNALLPVAYGRCEMPGLVFALGYIGSDLVIGYLWCVGEIDAVEDVYVNDEVLPAGVTATHYTGTPTQGVDPTLESAITAYADTLRFDTPTGKRGAAYTVLRIPTGEIDGWPRVRAIVRGRKVYDPRTSTTAYSDNSALCLGDLITDPDYGLGMPNPGGLAECADWCDSLLGGVSPRARIALAIQRGRRIYPDLLDLLSEYAECWYTLDGPGITLIPDQPVDLATAPTIGPAQIVQQTLALVSEDTTDAPTEVEIRYTEPTGSAEPWQSNTLSRAIAGVAQGDRPRIPTSVRLEGIYRGEEAANKATARLNRQRNRVTATWQTTDAGVVHQKGDVVHIDHPMRGVDMPFRITGVRLVAPGRYEVAGHRYDPNHYPDELDAPDGTVFVPDGLILPFAGATVPDGWSTYLGADGKYIIGAGGSYAIGATGGDTTHAGLSGSTTTDPLHPETSDTFPVIRWDRFGSVVGYPNDNPGAINHAHTFDTGTLTPDLHRRHQRLVIKNGAGSSSVPSDCRIFGLDGLSEAVVERITQFAGRYLFADSENANAGVASQNVNIETSRFDEDHRHYRVVADYQDETDFTNTVYNNGSSSGAHEHQIETPLQINLKRRLIGLYGSGGNYSIIPGMIAMFEGSTIPADWVLCDGANGTPDMRDYFLMLAGASADVVEGANELKIAGTVEPHTHGHWWPHTEDQVTRTTIQRAHKDMPHDHSFEASSPWMPPYYALAFIMYAPAD